MAQYYLVEHPNRGIVCDRSEANHTDTVTWKLSLHVNRVDERAWHFGSAAAAREAAGTIPGAYVLRVELFPGKMTIERL